MFLLLVSSTSSFSCHFLAQYMQSSSPLFRLTMPGPPMEVSEERIPLVVAMGIYTAAWREVRRQFPCILNCCICVAKAFRKQRYENTNGSGFDEETRDRMKQHETWATAWAAGACVLREFGFLIILCNHGRHRSLSLAYELAAHIGGMLFSIRYSTYPKYVMPVEEIMETLSSRLTWHVGRYGRLRHPVAGIQVCICGFDGTDWALTESSEHRRHRYLDLRPGDLLVQQRRTPAPSDGWAFGCKVHATCPGTFGWFPPSYTTSLPRNYFDECSNLLCRLVNF